MSKKIYKITAVVLTIIMAMLVGMAMYKLSGRAVVADFVRPFLAVLAVSFSAWSLMSLKRKWLGRLVFWLVGFPISLIVFLTYLYYVTIGSVFTGDDVVAIKQSNPEEIWDFFAHYILNIHSLSVSCAVLGFYFLLVKFSTKGFLPRLEAKDKSARNRGSNNVKDLEGNLALTPTKQSKRPSVAETTATSAADHISNDNDSIIVSGINKERSSNLSKTTLPDSSELLSQIANKTMPKQDLTDKKVDEVNLNKLQRFFKRGNKIFAWCSACIFLMAALILCTEFRPVAYYRLMAQDLQDKIETFNRLVREIESSQALSATKQAQGELYVLIIGESLSRDSMGVYNQAIGNTPYLNKLAENGRTVVFPNAYSSFVNTVPSITASFSQGNFATGLTFPHGGNLISLAKQAGITTHWISNQVKNGNADTPIGAISALADHSYFTTNYVFDGSYSQQPDEILLPKLKETFDSLDASKNNLVIIHLMGSHSPYYNRYPSDYPAIEVANAAKIGSLIFQPHFKDNIVGRNDYENYLTSIKYNDYIIEEIAKLYQDRPDFQAMVYYSDHGEALLYDSLKEAAQSSKTPAGRHNVAQFSFAMTRVPLIISMSEQFKQRYPHTFKAVFDNQDEIFTNDNLYDLMLELMQVKTEAVNLKLSIASSEYERKDANQVKLLNEKIVGTDPDYLAFAHAHQEQGSKLTIKSANSLFKANLAISKGYQNLHVDVFLKSNKLYVKALKEFDKSFLELTEYVKQLTGKPSLILDLDEKSVGKLQNHKAAEIIGKTLLSFSPELQERIYFMSENTVLLDRLVEFLTRYANSLPERARKAAARLNHDEETLSEVQNYSESKNLTTSQNVTCSFTDQFGHVIVIEGQEPCTEEVFARYQGKNKPTPEQIKLFTSSHGCDFEPFTHDGLPVKLIVEISTLNRLSQLEALPHMIHYVAFDDNLLSCINIAALCGRHLIVFEKESSVQEIDFAQKATEIRKRLPYEYMIVNYYNAFDSDF